jgi:hypothetical protein
MGNTPNQMVTQGMMMKVGVEMAPTTYDHTPPACDSVATPLRQDVHDAHYVGPHIFCMAQLI